MRGLETGEVIAEFKNPNSWQRDTALRVLDAREDLRAARGLHPGTPLHALFGDRSASPLARVYSVLALHRLELLDETLLENAADDPHPLVRTWAALLFGERGYPTGTAFQQLVKLGKETNLTVRGAVAVSARQFVSGSLTLDTAPRTIPLREVFTGGILSTLWFSTELGRTPGFDLLFWNAVRPITAYDSAHPMGFFNGDREEGLPFAYWIIVRIAQQIAEADDPLKQEDAMLMVAQLKPVNHRMILAALEGLKLGTPGRRVMPTEASRKVLEDFAKNGNCDIATRGRELLDAWSRPFKE
jgi:hypothetical protein